ncbi:MAG: serine kinase [Thermodesulfobacteriota bacterium]
MYKSPLTLFGDFFEAYKNAEVICEGPIQRFYEIGGLTIRLCFANPKLIPYITPALTHLAIVPVSDPSLTIFLFDSNSTNSEIPTLPWHEDKYKRRGEIFEFTNERIHISYQWGTQALSFLDKEQSIAIYWISDSKQIPYWDTGAPLLSTLHLWFGEKGLQMVHGGAVGMPEGGVLLVGKGGSGKSTSALSCLNSELFYAGDDYVLVAHHPVPTAHSVYCTGKVNSNDVEKFQFLYLALSNPDRLDEEKALYFLNDKFPKKITLSFPIRAILIPRITDESKTHLELASAKDALTALVPSTIIQMPYAGKKACEIMTKIAEDVPCYYLNLDTDLGNIPRVILSLLSKYNQ